jgi:hypothetical protein
MKKTVKKLVLNRETLRRMDVVGGATVRSNIWCITDNCTTGTAGTADTVCATANVCSGTCQTGGACTVDCTPGTLGC